MTKGLRIYALKCIFGISCPKPDKLQGPRHLEVLTQSYTSSSKNLGLNFKWSPIPNSCIADPVESETPRINTKPCRL